MQPNTNDIPLQVGDYRSKRRQSVLLSGDERRMAAVFILVAKRVTLYQ